MSVSEFVRISDKYLKRDEVKLVVECGALDCRESLSLADAYPSALVCTFECNPDTLPVCRRNAAANPRVILYEYAVTDTTGKCKFYKTNKQTITTQSNGNPGASSLFLASGKYPVETIMQDEISVKCISLKKFLDSYSLDTPEVIWMDIQGAELLALKGLGDRITDVKILYLEVEFMQIYADQPLHADIDKFLTEHGFVFVTFIEPGSYFSNAVYVNKGLVK